MFYGFPEQLNIQTIQPLFNGTTEMMYGNIRERETWYTIKSGNYNDPTIWRTVGGRRHDFPGSNTSIVSIDDVNINHAVTLSTSNSYVVNNLNISIFGSLGTFGTNITGTLTVNGNIQCFGILNFVTPGAAYNIAVLGNTNYIDPTKFTCSVGSNFTYSKNGDQAVLPLSYGILSITGAGIPLATKYQIGDVTVAGNLSLSGNYYDCTSYNLTVNGNITFNNNTNFIKTGAGNILIVGLFDVGGGSSNFSSGYFFGGNPNIEFRGGIRGTSSVTFPKVSGTGIWNFTTNSQTITSTQTFTMDAQILISGAISLTSSAIITMNSADIDGDNASSSFINSGTVNFSDSAHAILMPTLGTFDIATNANTLGYTYSGNGTLPLSTYYNLTVAGTGTKTLSATTSLTGNFIATTGIVSTSIFDLSTFGFTVNGTSNINSAFIIRKTSSSGNVKFVGLLTFNALNIVWDFTGNPAIELQNSYSASSNNPTFNGSSTWSFTTNNQTINGTAGVNFGTINMLISGAITVTFSGAGSITVKGTLNGDNAGSTFDNRATFSYQNATQPMVTGVLQTSAAANTFKYNLAGNQAVKGNAYKTIEFGGSGNKTLQGNCTDTSRSTTGTAVLVLNGFTIVP